MLHQITPLFRQVDQPVPADMIEIGCIEYIVDIHPEVQRLSQGIYPETHACIDNKARWRGSFISIYAVLLKYLFGTCKNISIA